MPKPKPLTRSFAFISNNICAPYRAGTMGSILKQVLPKEKADHLHELMTKLDTSTKFGETFMDTPVTMNANQELYDKASQRGILIPVSIEKETEILNNYKEVVDYFKELAKDEAVQKSPAARFIINNQIHMGELTFDGKNADHLRAVTPVRGWIQDAPGVDMVSEYVDPATNEKVEAKLEDYDAVFEHIQADKLEDLTYRHMELMHELETQPVGAVRKAEITTELKSICKELVETAEAVDKAEAPDSVKRLFSDYSQNVQGNRGVNKAAQSQAQKELELLEAGWDPQFVADYIVFSRVTEDLTEMAEFVDKYKDTVPGFDKFSAAIKKLQAADPTQKVFDKQTDFIKSYQEYADAANEFIEVTNSPELIDSLQKMYAVDDNNRTLPAGQPKQPMPFGVSAQDYRKTDINTYVDHSPPTNHTGAKIFTQNVHLLADVTNFKKRGITIDDNGEAVFSDKVIDDNISALTKLSTIAEDALTKMTELIKRSSDENMDFDEYREVSDVASAITSFKNNSMSGYMSYEDTEVGLKKIIKATKIYQQYDFNDPARDQLIDEAKNYAEQALENLRKAKPEGLDVMKPFSVIIDEMTNNREAYREYAKEAVKTPSALKHDYSHIRMLGTAVHSNADLLEQIFGENAYTPDMQANAARMSGGSTYADTGSINGVSFDIYGSDGGIDKYESIDAAPTHELIQKANADTQYIADVLGSASEKLSDNKYPAVKAYFDYLNGFAQSALKGDNDVEILKHIPGSYYFISSPDWRKPKDVPQDQILSSFNDMFTGMKYVELFDTVKKRVAIKKELKDAVLTPEQKKEYAQKLKESNNEIIGILTHQMSDECEQKYKGHFQKYSDTIKGQRGNHINIKFFEERNKALDNGWDPTRIDDYTAIKKLANDCKDSNDIFDRFNNPKLARLASISKKIAKNAPDKMTFKNQFEYDNYVLEMSRLSKDLYEEAQKPEVLNEIKGILDAALKEENEYDAYMDLRRKEYSAHRKDPSVVVRPPIERPDIVNKKRLLSTLSGDVISHSLWLTSFSEGMDITHTAYKGDPQAAAQRDKEVTATKNLIAIDGVEKNISLISKYAANKLKKMNEEIDGLKSVPSKEYNAMKLALAKVAGLSQSGCSTNGALKAIDELEKTTKAYTKKGLRSNARKDFANELNADAVKCKNLLSESAKKMSSQCRDKNLGEFKKQMGEDTNTLDVFTHTKSVMNDNKNLNAFKDAVRKALDDIHTNAGFFIVESDARNVGEKGHTEYRRLVRSSKLIDKNIEDMKPKDVFDTLVRLRDDADKYAKSHKGLTSGNIGLGRNRYDHSVVIRDKLNAAMDKIAKAYYSLHNIDPDKNISQQLDENTQYINANIDAAKEYYSEHGIIDTLKPKTWINKLAEDSFDNNRPADEVQAAEATGKIKDDIAKIIAAKQINNKLFKFDGNLDVNIASVKEQKSLPFDMYKNGIMQSEGFTRMMTPPQGVSEWDHLMSVKNTAMQNNGNDLLAKFMNTSLEVINERNNVQVRQSGAMNHQLQANNNPQMGV